MNLNPIDIIIVIFLICMALWGGKNGLIVELKKTFSFIVAIFASNIIIKNLSSQFSFLNKQTDISFLGSFLVIFIISALLLGFIIDLIIEQSDDFDIDKYLNKLIGCALGVVKGIVVISLTLFVFDTTPIDQGSKDKIYSKISDKSIFIEQCNDLKELIFKD